MPRRRAEELATANAAGRTSILPASTLARSSRSLTSSAGLGRLADEADLLLLLVRELAVDAVEQEARQREDRVQRRAELVAHVGQEARLQSRSARLELVGLLVELGVERDDAAVGVLELAR